MINGKKHGVAAFFFFFFLFFLFFLFFFFFSFFFMFWLDTRMFLVSWLVLHVQDHIPIPRHDLDFREHLPVQGHIFVLDSYFRLCTFCLQLGIYLVGKNDRQHCDYTTRTGNIYP